MRIIAAFAALVFVLAFVFAPQPHRHARAANTPTAVSVVYYDGVYTRGWTWRTDTGVAGGQVQLIEKTGSLTKHNIKWDDASVTGHPSYLTKTAASAASPAAGKLAWKASHDFTAAANGKT
ncbi:MAG: hypothetical protein FWE62_06985, partial [Firmicutes bacterium]|nr:hypothetical protein [Bacillota bacterium]